MRRVGNMELQDSLSCIVLQHLHKTSRPQFPEAPQQTHEGHHILHFQRKHRGTQQLPDIVRTTSSNWFTILTLAHTNQYGT